jgi:lysophospholipase L1-like esterase
VSGVAAVPKHKSAWARASLRGLDPDEPVLREICYRLPPGASFVARVGTEVTTLRRTSLAADEPATCRALPDAPARAELSVERPVGDPLILGAILERRTPGVVVDTLGINGARIATMLAWDESHFIEMLRARAPSLVVLAYGTNEVFDDLDVGRYPDQYRKVLGRIRQALPEVECLLLGPPDAMGEQGGSHERVRPIDRVQARAAVELGCAYLSSFELMGGDGSFARWAAAEPPLARTDGIHLTPLGYQRLGDEVQKRLLGTQ